MKHYRDDENKIKKKHIPINS